MLISFIVLYYKQEIYFEKLLKSIFYSRIPTDSYEIIVIDNNSNDSIINVVNNYSKKINIKYFNNEIQKNQSRSRNIGINNSNGKYIFYMDSDDYYNPVYLNKIYNNINNFENDIILISSLIEIRNSKKYIIKNTISINEPTLSTCQYLVNKNYIKKNLWDEKKYYWDNEDLWYGFNLLNNNDNNILVTEYPIITHIKLNGSNSDRKNTLKYKLYFLDLLNECLTISKKVFLNKILNQFLKQFLKE